MSLRLRHGAAIGASSLERFLSPLSSFASLSISSTSFEDKRWLSSSSKKTSWQSRRSTPRNYRQPKTRKLKANKSLLYDPINDASLKKVRQEVHPGSPSRRDDIPVYDELPPEIQEQIRQTKRDRARGSKPDVEYMLRYSDYLTAAPHTTEEKMLERRIMSEAFESDEEGQEFVEKLDEMIEEAEYKDLEFGEDDIVSGTTSIEKKDENERHQDSTSNPNSELPPNAQWGETVVRMDRVQKVQRGGTIVRYRCLVIGGNLKGVAGFGIGKAAEPREATEAASRMCKRNIFFVDAYKNHGLTTDLVGKHNSCIVRLRSVPGYRGLKGHPLIRDILLYFGISSCSAKSHGNRNIYNVVYATFKAIMTHKSIEEYARARGKRFLGLDKAKRISFK